MSYSKYIDKLQYAKKFENLLNCYGYKLKVEQKKMLENIAMGSNDIFEFLTDLGIEYEISNELNFKISLLLGESGEIRIGKMKGDRIIFNDQAGDKASSNKRKEGYLYDYTIIKIFNLNSVYINLSNKINTISSIFLKNKLYVLAYVTTCVIISILTYLLLMTIRITIDTYLYYKNQEIISFVLFCIFILLIIVMFINKIKYLILNKFSAKEYIFAEQAKKNTNSDSIVDILFKSISLPFVVICYSYIIYIININLLYFTFFSILFIIGIVHLFTILLDSFKTIQYINIKKSITKFILRAVTIAFNLIFIYLNICLFFHDTISLGMIFMSVGAYIILSILFHNRLDNIDILKKVRLMTNVYMFKNYTKSINKNIRDFNFEIIISLFKINENKILRNTKLTKNSINLLLGPASSGKTLLGKTLAGYHTGKESNILIDNIPLFQININNLKKSVCYIDNQLIGECCYDSLDSLFTLNTESDVDFIFKSLGIYYLKNLEENCTYVLTDTERMMFNFARIILRDYYVLIFDNILSRLENKKINQILDLCRQLEVLVIVLEQKNIEKISWDQIIKI